MEKYAVIVAGGSGTRMGASIPKQFLLLNGKPLLWHSISVFVHTFPDIRIVLVLPEEFLQQGKEIIAQFPLAQSAAVIAGCCAMSCYFRITAAML